MADLHKQAINKPTNLAVTPVLQFSPGNDDDDREDDAESPGTGELNLNSRAGTHTKHTC
jgi:hypothetical protein